MNTIIPPRFPPPLPVTTHRRNLAAFARWLATLLDVKHDTRESIVALAERISSGGMCEADRDAAIDEMDRLMFGEMG